jgi:hypothetical protein
VSDCAKGCPAVAADRIIIEELLLQLPGLSADAARAVSAEVAQRVGAGLAAALPKRSVGALELRLHVRPGADQQELAAAMSGAILEAVLR